MIQLQSILGSYTNSLLFNSGVLQTAAPKAPASFDEIVKEMVSEDSKTTNSHGDTAEISDEAYEYYNADNKSKSVLYGNLLDNNKDGYKVTSLDSKLIAGYANYV